MASAIVKSSSSDNSLLDLYAKIYSSPRHFFLHSSVMHGDHGRYSYMGCNPSILFTAKKNHIVIQEKTGSRSITGNSFDEFAKIQVPGNFSDKSSAPFGGGWVGYWGYDCKDHLEKLDDAGKDDPDLPDALWMRFDAVLVMDHETGTYSLSGLPDAVRELEGVLDQPAPQIEKFGKFDFQVTPTESLESYSAKIETIRSRIAAGDVYEANLTQRFDLQLSKRDHWTDFLIFKSLIETSPAPFSAIIKSDTLAVISSSPELFLKIDGREAESKPIKGTRARKGNFDEDETAFLDLLNSEKDRAENLMIVDLVRNDLGRVSEAASVRVKSLFHIERYATVFQMVSTIQSRLGIDKSLHDAVKACFPPGSMTGAPKISAMNILEGLEPFKRGVYSGALGYMDFRGNGMLSVIIRTLILNGESGYFQTGGAIVWDSVPEAEYQECLDKAEGILKALEKLRRS